MADDFVDRHVLVVDQILDRQTIPEVVQARGEDGKLADHQQEAGTVIDDAAVGHVFAISFLP